MAKVSQKKLDEFLAQTKKDLSGERTGTQVRQTDVDDFLKAFRSDLESSYTQEERDQMKAARAASLRPGETRRSGRSSETTGTVRTDGWSERYSRIRDRADYGENSRFRSTKTGEPVYNALLNSYTDTGYGDALYDYINGDAGAGKVLRNRMSSGDPFAVTTDLSFVEQMTDEERADYNYIHATEGAKQAERYLDYIQSDLYRRQREAEEQRLEDYAKQHPVKATVESIAAAPFKGLTYAGQAAEAIANKGELDANAPYNRFAYTPNAMRAAVSDRIEEKWGKVGSFGYNTAMSMADFLTASGMSGGSGLSMAIMGSGAAADAALEALDRGVDGNRALALGAVAGAAEYFTEKFSVEQLFNRSWDESTLKYIVKNILTESGEEGASSLINSIADVLISGDKSEWQQMVQAYEEQGFSDKEAFKRTFWEHMKMLGLDVLGGAISGGLMAGGSAAVGAIGMGAMNRENIRSEQEAVRAAVNEQRREIRDSVADPDTLTPERETFETGAEVRRDQLMTLDEEDLANRIENAEDETEATAIKYGATDKQLKQVRELSDITGREVVFFRQKSENGKVRNGYYNPNDGRIYVNVNASRSKTTPMVVAHEITHTLEGTEAYRDLNALVMADIRRSGRDPEQMREDKRKMYAQAGVTLADESAIDSEIVAEEAEQFLGNVRAIAEVFREKPSLGRTIASALDRMLIRVTGTSEEMYISRAARLYERAEELADSAETEINRRLDEQETVQTTGGESAAQTGSPVQRTAPQGQPASAAAAPGSSETAIPASEEQRKPSETVGQRQTAPQTGGTVSGGAETRPAGTEAQESVRTSMDESDTAERMLEDLNRRYENGEISDEEYDEAYELIEEARLTGRGIESSADVVDNVEGKIPRGIRKLGGKLGIRPKGEQYSISEDDVRERVANGRPVEAADENMRDIAGEIADKIRGEERWSISEEEDRRYIDAARSGNTESAQKMVDKAAKAAGYDVDAFHGTDGGDFYVFDWDKTQSTDGGFFGRGHYFTKYRGVAQQYGERVVEAKLNLGKTFVWSEEVNTYNGIRPPEILSRNIVSRINLAKHFPDIFADQKMSYFEYDEKRGEYVDKNIKWENLEDVINAISDDLILRPYADGTFKWHTEGRFWEVPVGETYSSEQEAEDGKFFAAINALKEKYDGLFDTMSLDDQTTYTQAYGSEITEILKKNGYDSAMDTPDGGEIVVFDSSRIKSAAPITYDESGKIIPLSERFKRDNSDIRYSVSEDEDTTPYGGLPVKAQNRVRDLERKFGVAMDKMFGLGMTYKSPDFRQFLADNVRPLVNTYLENGSIPQEESDALFRSFYNPLSGTDEDLQRQEFYSAFEQMEEGLRNAARFAEAQNATEDTEAPENPMPTTEEAEELFRVQRDARREMDKVMAKLLLTPQDEVTVGELLRGTRSEDQITENRHDILEAYRVQKAFRDADAAVSVYKKRLKAELYRHVDAYLGNIAQWKDKAVPLLYQRETMERNIRDIIPDKAEADAFIAEFITPVHHAEAERQRFLGEYRDRVRKLGLSSKVQKGNAQSEAYAVQLLGEAQDNIRILSLSGRLDQKRDGHTLTEWQLLVDFFWDANPNMDRAKIERAIGEFRKIYNELLPKINEVRIRNGYAPVAFRQGYFPHFTATSEDTVLAKLLRPFGIQFNADALPTAINGLTADFKPGITYFQFGNERLGFETTYDALQGYEMYLNAASDVIYHTDNIQKLRALATRIRYLTGDEGVKQQIDKVRNNDTLDEAEKQVQLEEIYRKGRYRMSNFVVAADEYTNALANKKSRFDRGVEELFGRPAYSVMKALESRVASNMIAGNLGSALTNIIPLNQANAIIGNVNVLKGMYQTVRGMTQDDGFAAASDFLTNRRGSDSLVRTTSQKISDMASIPMNLIDNFVSESIVRAAYMKNLAGGMGEDLALQHADALAASIMADRSKGALPLLFNARNPLMKLFTQFQVEVNNEYSVIFKDIPELAKTDAKTRAGAAARIAGMLFKYLVGAWLFNDLYEKLFGRRAALDPVEMLNNAVGGISGYQVPNVVDLAGEALTGDLTAEDFAVEAQDPGKVLQTLGTEAAESLPFIGGVLGGGRVPIQSALPDLSNLTMAATSDTWTGKKKALTAFEELSKPAAYLLPPFGGGQIQKMLRGGAAALQGGVYGVEGDEDGGTYLKYPVYDDWQDRLNAIVFGTTYTEGGREWVDSGFKSLSVKQTTAYQAMKEFGADDRAAYDLIRAYKSVPDGEGRSAAQRDVIRSAGIPGGAKYAAYYNLGASDARRALMDAIADTEPEANLGEAAEVLMDISDIRTGKTAGVCDLLAQSGLTEETKKLIYRQEVSDQRDDDIAAAAWAGITFEEYLDAHGAYSAIGNKDLSKAEQALEFARYVDGTNLSDAQKDTAREIFKYYSQIPVQAKNYNELRDIGISDDHAAKLVRAVDALEPLPGEKSVSSIQKARVVVDTISDADDRLAALGTVLSDSQFRKVSIAADAGLDPEVWVAFREILPEFDSDANGSYTQEEMEDAIRAFSNGSNYGTTLMKAARNLSRDEMAILWQIGGSWKSSNNPFSKTTGKYVKDLLDAEKKG